VSVKTQHAGRRILNDVGSQIIQLRKDGILDEIEIIELEKVNLI